MTNIYLIEREHDTGDRYTDWWVDPELGAYTSAEAAQEVVDRTNSLIAEEEAMYEAALRKWTEKRVSTQKALSEAGITGVSMNDYNAPYRSQYVHTSRLTVSDPIEVVA